MSRSSLPALTVAGLAMAAVVIFSNWLMQGNPLDPTLPQEFVWLNDLFGYEGYDRVFVYGQFTFPLAFLITDIINRVFGPQRAATIIAVGAIFGGIASYYFATPWIAFASITAFVVGQLLDVGVFQRLRQMAWFIAPLVSSILASLIDTGLFYGIAFGFTGEENSWVLPTARVDFYVKVFVALVALLPFRLLIAAMLGNRQTA